MKKIIAAVMTFIVLMSSLALSGCSETNKANPVSLANAETVVFGHYRDEDLEWIVLDHDGRGNQLVISKYVIEVKKYNEISLNDSDYQNQTWEISSLRSWLNNEFYTKAFTSGERYAIKYSQVLNSPNSKYRTKGGYLTNDKVFLLSIEEAKSYFASDEDLRAKPMGNADSYPALWTDSEGCCNWWLRSPGCEGFRAANVRDSGFIYLRGDINTIHDFGVRPAMWVNFSAVKDEDEDTPVSTTAVSETTTETTTEPASTYIDTSLVRNAPNGNIFFGNFGTGSLEWIVLEKKDNKALLITKDVIYVRPYMESESDTTWENCSLRTWLNNDFYNQAFFEGEKYLINTTTVVNSSNAEYGTRGGSDTEDKVFVLSVDEANKYFHSDSSRQAVSSGYAAYTSSLYVDSNGCCLWWLRTPGAQGCAASYVDHLGRVKDIGIMNRYNYIGVRPAVWVTIE